MSFSLRSLPVQCAVLALAFVAASPAASSVRAGAKVECLVNGFWSDRQETYASNYLPKAEGEVWGIQPQTVEVVYKSTGADRLRGAARRRVLSYGVLWLIDPAKLGVSESAAISALLKAGAVISRPNGDGRVYYRARKEDAAALAQRAVEALGQSRARVSLHEKRGAGKSGSRAVATLPLNASKLKAEVAMMRVEGRLSRSPLQFIEYIPAGMMVMPFGTSFVVHVRPRDFPALQSYIEMEGSNVFLVGARSEVVLGDRVGGAIRSCGGRMLEGRFPTPTVTHASRDFGIIDVEGQRLRVSEGDAVLVVQRPRWGRGLEIAMLRFE